MKTQKFFTIGAAFLAVLAITLLATSGANGQDKGTPVKAAPAARPPATFKVGNRALQRTAFQTNPDFVSTSCSTSACSAKTALFIRTLQCDGGSGKTCTFYLHIDSQLGVSNSDNGLLQFLVDGLPPSPGPTDSHGFVSWNDHDPDSGGTPFEVHSFSVVAFVTNTSTNQKHDIEVDIQCDDNTASGCNIDAGFATLQGVVYTP